MLDHEAVMEEATKIALARADSLYPDRNSAEWKKYFEEKKYGEFYLMVTPPNRCPCCNMSSTDLSQGVWHEFIPGEQRR